MPYHPAYNHYSVGLTEEEERDAMLALREREVKVSEQRLELEREQAKAAAKGRFWDILQAVALAGIPIITFLGWDNFFRKRRK